MWSCAFANGTDGAADTQLCQRLGLSLSVFSFTYLFVFFPVGFCYNALVVAVNLSNKASMTMPDVYFVNMAMASLVLGLVGPMQLLGPEFSRSPLWRYSDEVHVTLIILFNVSSLVIMYSATLLSLDCYIERVLPRTYMSSVYNTKHVCGFLWGGAVLTSFSSLLFYVCNHVSTKIVECSKMQNKEVADTIMLLIGYVVPAAATSYALVLIHRIRKQPTHLDQDLGRLDPSVYRLLLAAVSMQFILWTPYYIILLVHTISRVQGTYVTRPVVAFNFLRGLSVLLAFSSSFATPLLYRQMSRTFSLKLQRLLRKLQCGERTCTHEPPGLQQVVL
ncbi:probable G-protein coupled receptor 146 isoform X1 [Paramormyrops kingsleyae]|uniref:probable G-protein coupled receptor 146 isoform X1 n=2 Tax=Paramormyrops kingsleyae TaxID=1676925 RepID=UPI003B97900C